VSQAVDRFCVLFRFGSGGRWWSRTLHRQQFNCDGLGESQGHDPQIAAQLVDRLSRNFVGALGTAALVFFTQQYSFAGGAIGTTALSIARGKVIWISCRQSYWV